VKPGREWPNWIVGVYQVPYYLVRAATIVDATTTAGDCQPAR
jgi:hypothetical protein